MRFDAYSATIHDALPDQISANLVALLGGLPVAGKGLFGYSHGIRIQEAGEVLALLLFGGKNPGVHVQVQGEDAVRWSSFLRGASPEHVVTRADVCEDLDGPGTWDRLFGVVNGLAGELGIAIDCRGDWITPGSPLGRTLYVGAPSSAVRVRLYEKGKQLVATGQAAPGSVSLDWCRLEVQTRPEGESRAVAATSGPEGFWGYAVWSTELARRAFGLDVERVHVKELRRRDTHRSLRAMAEQYAGVVQERARELGSGEAALREVEALLRAVIARKEGA